MLRLIIDGVVLDSTVLVASVIEPIENLPENEDKIIKMACNNSIEFEFPFSWLFRGKSLLIRIRKAGYLSMDLMFQSKDFKHNKLEVEIQQIKDLEYNYGDCCNKPSLIKRIYNKIMKKNTSISTSSTRISTGQY